MRKLGLAFYLALLAPLAGPACNTAGNGQQDSTSSEPPSEEFASSRDGESSAATQGDLDRDWERLSVEEQRRVLLRDEHIAQARDLLGRGYLREAAEEAARARELDPDSLEAARLVAETNAMLGEDAGDPGALAQELEDRYHIKVQQLQNEAREYVRRGQVLLGRGDYDAAVGEFTLALDNMRWAAYSVDWGGLQQEAEAGLAEAQQKRDQGEEAQRLAAESEAYQLLQEREAADRERREARTSAILSQAIEAFEREDYETAQELADKVLVEDPKNEKAADVRDAAFRAGRDKFRAEFLERKRSQYARWDEEIQELLVPWTGVITLPDAETWEAKTALRKGRTEIHDDGDDEASRALREKLVTALVPALSIEGVESLREVVDTVRTLTNLPLVTDQSAEDAAFQAGAIFDIKLTNPLPAINVLDLIAERAGGEVAWNIKHDAVIFTTKEKVRGRLAIKNHAVEDLVFGLTDFLGPRIDRIRLLDELEDDDGGGPFGGLGEIRGINVPEDLIALVQENVASDSWEGDGITVDIFPSGGGNMVVVQTPEVQRQIAQFLEDLRLFSSSMVTIESRFLRIEDNWLQEIGVEFRGIDNPGIPFTDLDDITNGGEDNASQGLDNGGTGTENNASGSPSAGFFYDDGEDGDFKGHTENVFTESLGSALTNIGGLTAQWSILDDAQISLILRLIEKSSQVELINSQVLSVQNTQRAYVTVVNQRAYIQDFDVEVAQFEAIADPQINVLHEGIVLDVRPTIHHDRRYLTLELQPTVAKVVALNPFSTGLGANTSPVEFQLPELEVASVFTTAVIPDGGSVLLGGLSRVRQIERRSGTPWLMDIPIVGILFKDEGYNDEKSSLMVMLRAWITDVREELQRLER